MNKVFALVDCNNFYVSCERIFNPKLHNYPVVVLSNNDGCIIARSEEAKLLDIAMGMPYYKAQPIINKHKVQVYSSNYTLYGSISNRVMKILGEMVPRIEHYPIDESFLDLSHLKINKIEEFGEFIINRVYSHTSIPVSVGIGATKTLAKLANSIAKKQQTIKSIAILNEEERIKYLKNTSVKDIWGIGRQYAKFLIENNIETAYDLSLASDLWIKKNMKIIGLKSVNELRGKSCLELEEFPKEKKSITVSRSFSEYITSLEVLKEPLISFVSKGAEKLRKSNLTARTIGVMIKTNKYDNKNDYYSNYSSISLMESTNYTPELVEHAIKVLKSIYKSGYRYKKLGIILLDIEQKEKKQVGLFSNKDEEKRKEALMKAIDKINKVSSIPRVYYAGGGKSSKWLPKRENLSKNYTTSWDDILVAKA